METDLVKDKARVQLKSKIKLKFEVLICGLNHRLKTDLSVQRNLVPSHSSWASFNSEQTMIELYFHHRYYICICSSPCQINC